MDLAAMYVPLSFCFTGVWMFSFSMLLKVLSVVFFATFLSVRTSPPYVCLFVFTRFKFSVFCIIYVSTDLTTLYEPVFFYGDLKSFIFCRFSIAQYFFFAPLQVFRFSPFLFSSGHPSFSPLIHRFPCCFKYCCDFISFTSSLVLP